MARSSSTVSLRNYRLRSLVKIEPKLRGLGIKYILGLYNRVLQLYGGLYIIHIWHSINFKTWNFMFSPLLSSIISKFTTQFPERQMKILKVKEKKISNSEKPTTRNKLIFNNCLIYIFKCHFKSLLSPTVFLRFCI